MAHTLQGLTTVSTPQAPRRWLLPFTPGTYAWWQLVTLSLNVPGQDLVTVEAGGLSGWPVLAAAEGVTAVSATPTFWRHSLLRDRAAVTALRLEQITLGGEPVDQRLLNELTTAFPEARVSWIYASTETGAAFAVHVSPGFFDSEMSAVLGANQVASIARRTPTGRLVTPEDILPLIRTLLLEHTNINGQVITADGGGSI